MKTTNFRRLAMATGALCWLCMLPSCVVLPFGHDGGADRADHRDRRMQEGDYPAPDLLPFQDADDDSGRETVRLPSGLVLRTTLVPRPRPAVLVLPIVKHTTAGLWA
jgi:hypothetical protein